MSNKTLYFSIGVPLAVVAVVVGCIIGYRRINRFKSTNTNGSGNVIGMASRVWKGGKKTVRDLIHTEGPVPEST